MSENNTSSQGQYLTFTLGKEIFALDIVKVREVLEITNFFRNSKNSGVYERSDQSQRACRPCRRHAS